MKVVWQRREATFFQAIISERDDTTKLEWVVDSDFRFFPTRKDDDFGYVLHPIDLEHVMLLLTCSSFESRARSTGCDRKMIQSHPDVL